jgi:ribosome-associated protein
MQITDQLHIPDHELTWTFVRAGGPGGQNVNKVASKAVLRWDLSANVSLPGEVRGRLREQQRGRITLAGELLISSDRHRDQERNRRDCLDRLQQMVLQASIRPRPRRKTRPTRGSHERRLHAKRRRADVKRGRGRPTPD